MRLIELLKTYKTITKEDIDHLISQGYEIKEINQSLNYLEDNFEFYFADQKYLNVELNDLGKGIFTQQKTTYYIDYKPVSVKLPKQKIINGDLVLYQKNNGIYHIIKVLKHSVEQMIGYVFFKRKKAYFNPLMPNLKQVYNISNANAFKLGSVYRAVFTGEDRESVKLLEEIKNISKLNTKVETYLKLKDVRQNFNNKIKKELSNFDKAVTVENYPKYKDFTKEYFFTIDGSNAKDFDDAVALSKHEDFYRLKVAIADVSSYVRYGSAIDKEAAQRATSIYFLNQVIPMLPFELADDLCSLKPNVNCLALVLTMDIKDGVVIDYKFNRAIINSKHRLTYEYVNEILNQEPKNKLEAILHMMNFVAKQIRAVRVTNGAISFKEDELSFELENGKVKAINKRQRYDAELMIEDFMLCSNQTVATHMHNLELPMVYRNHDYPKLENLEQYLDTIKSLGHDIKGKSYQMNALILKDSLEAFKGQEVYDIVSDLLLRSMAKAKYESYSNGHFALTFENYCHFTSPIRRYPDLLVHRLIHKYVLDCNYNGMQEDEKILQELITKSNEQEKFAVELERQINDMAIASYMADKLGQVFDAKIVSVTNFGVFVTLENGSRGLVHILNIPRPANYDEENAAILTDGQVLKVGVRIRVKLIFVDEFMGKLDFRMLTKRRSYR